MEISAIWLRVQEGKILVSFERDGKFYRAITETITDGPLPDIVSHITELNITGRGEDAGKPRPKPDFAEEM